MIAARLRALLSQQHGVTAVETALILPVLLFGVMMLFELARISLMIGIGNLGLERALQDFRGDKAFYRQTPRRCRTPSRNAWWTIPTAC